MMSLLLKDLRVCRLYLLVIVPWTVLFSSQWVFQTSYAVIYLFLAWGLAVLPLILEAVHDTEATTCSFPVSRSRVVKARFFSAGAALAFTALLCRLHGWLMGLATGGAQDIRSLNSLGEALVFLMLAALVLATFLPFHFGFGLIRGSYFFILALMTALAALAAFEAFGWQAEAGELDRLSGLGRWAAGFSLSWGMARTVTLSICGLLAVAVSVPVSIWLYERRDI